MMTETLRWVDTTIGEYESGTRISVEIGGEAADLLRQHYGQGGKVRVTHSLVVRGGNLGWSATLWIGDEVVHKEPEEVTVTEHSTIGGDDEWLTHLTGGHRMIRHLIGLVG